MGIFSLAGIMSIMPGSNHNNTVIVHDGQSTPVFTDNSGQVTLL